MSDLARLRELLLGVEQAALLEFSACLNDPERYREHLADVVTEAIASRDARDESVARLFSPVVERSLTESVRTNPEPIADALYPIMGPAIRKSISDTLNQAMEGFNQALERSLSLRAMKWRFDALRSGRSYAEIALLNTLDFEVQQVFLIHRETSLLLRHRVADSAVVKDADMVSSMLSAIQDFVDDSFTVDDADRLSTLRLGTLTVCIETGPKAVLAAVVHGSVPESLRTTLYEAIESIHATQHRALAEFDGDAAPFEAVDPALDRCMVSQQQPGKTAGARQRPWLAATAMALMVCVVGLWQWNEHRDVRDWHAALERLAAEPGVVVIDAREDEHGYRVVALRDAHARDPRRVVGADVVERLGIRWRFEGYEALDPILTARRVIERLPLPGEVAATLVGDELQLAGRAPAAVTARLVGLAAGIPGVARIDTTTLESIAPPTIAAALPAPAPVESIDARVRRLQTEIRALIIPFASGRVEPAPGSRKVAARLVASVATLQADIEALDGTLRLRIKGYSDTSGSAAANGRISQRRAEAAIDLVRAQGLALTDVEAIGMGSKARPAGENERQVRFAVDVAF